MKFPTTVATYGALKIVKSGRYFSVVLGQTAKPMKNRQAALAFAELGAVLVRAFCFDRRATNLYFNPARPGDGGFYSLTPTY